MLYIFFGKDSVQVREKALTFTHTISVDSSSVIKITSDGFNDGILRDLAGSVPLFGGEEVILLDTPSSDVAFAEGVERDIDLLKESANHFVIIEGGLLAGKKKLYTTHAEQIEEIVSEAEEKFNAFSLAEAFLNRDKKALWLRLMEAWEAGESNEAIVGIIFWQIKVLRIVEKTSSPEESGQKPYTYNKAKAALRNFKKGELEKISRELVELYHGGHQGKVDMSTALEKWVLGM